MSVYYPVIEKWVSSWEGTLIRIILESVILVKYQNKEYQGKIEHVKDTNRYIVSIVVGEDEKFLQSCELTMPESVKPNTLYEREN